MARRQPFTALTHYTEDGRKVIGGVFKLFDTLGTPLDMVLGVLDAKGIVVDWPEFIEDAFHHGWKEKTLRTRLQEAIPDVYGPAYYVGWRVRFEAYLGRRNAEE